MSNLTSLSFQLKKLQLPQVNLLNNDKKRASFLYDPKEAANLDSESVYCLAMNGLTQLKSIDTSLFESFESTLFNTSSITFERSIQTKQVNEHINSEIRRFLINLSPYFMLKSAHKAFEWLIYRYQIHNYNLDEFFMCILPFHETNYFVRALQLINFDSTNKHAKLWDWLSENQKKGVPLAPTTLATHLFSDLSFFNFIINYVNTSIDILYEQDTQYSKSLNFVFSFLTKTLLQAIKQLGQDTKFKNKQQEAFFAQLLPFLFKGFKSDLIVYKQTSYVVASLLFETFKFNPQTINKTLFTISKGLSQFKNDSLDTEGLECIKSALLTICLLIQSQTKNLNSKQTSELDLMNGGFMKKLVKNIQSTQLVEIIDQLNEAYRIDKFLQCLFKRLLLEAISLDETNQDAFNKINLDLDDNQDDQELKTKGTNQFSELLNDLITLLNMNRSPKLADYLINTIFESLLNQLDTNNNSLPNLLVEYHLCELLAKLEVKYTKQVDDCLNNLLKGLTNQQKNYILNTISCKFGSFKCITSFKYQQIKNLTSDLNLLLGLNSTNESIRACCLDFIRNELELVSSTGKSKLNLDHDFIKEQLLVKLKSEDSAQVVESLFKFDLKLIDYVSLDELERLILRFFDQVNQDETWLTCQRDILNFLFTSLFNKYFTDNSELFLNSFIQILTKLFEMKSITLLKHLKTTSMFSDLFQDKINNSIDVIESPKSVSSKFYTSSISLTKIASGMTQTSRIVSESEKNDLITSDDDQLNDLFETYLSLIVKYIISHKETRDNSLSHFKCFEHYLLTEQPSVTLLDFIVFEISVRMCTQSLFLTNAFFFLKLATKILTNWFSKKTTLKLKKFKSQPNTKDDDSKQVDQVKRSLTFTSYTRIIEKKSIRDADLIQSLYHILFKSINIQFRSFVNSNAKLEVETILNYLYVHLCIVSNESQFFDLILKKFSEMTFFTFLTHSNLVTTNSPTPTKITLTQNSNISNSFLQFAFKFLIHSSDKEWLNEIDSAFLIANLESDQTNLLLITQLRTIQLFDYYLVDLVSNLKSLNEKSMLNSLVLVLLWCLASSHEVIRIEALNLLDKISQNDNLIWFDLIYKLKKHKQEIQIDGVKYLKSKFLNKTLQSIKSSNEVFNQIDQLLACKTLDKQTFFSNYLNDSSAILILNKFKFIILDTFNCLNDQLKLNLINQSINLFLDIINSMVSYEKVGELFKAVIQQIVDYYFVTSKSGEYFAQNEKHFDYLIGYLQTTTDNKLEIVHFFNEKLIEKLADSNGFFQSLTLKMQDDLVKCCFDLWINNNSQVKQCLSTFNLESKHFITILKEKCNLTDTKDIQAQSTKSMKKQLNSKQNFSLITNINWKYLKYLIELLQFKLTSLETDISDTPREESDLIELIPFMFQVLEISEETLALKESKQIDADIDTQDVNYLELCCLNCLLIIYKMNLASNKLNQSDFNFDLLMQMLKLKRNESNENDFKVQENVLLLLSEIAGTFPDKLLEHVLIMFVFVGDKLARKDDSYTFHIISKIIKTTLPPIVHSISQDTKHDTDSSLQRLKNTVNVVQRHQKQLPYVSSLVCKILQSFVVALPHIPAHRKTVIFNELLQIIGLNDYLWITIIQSIDHYLVQSNDLLQFTNSLVELTSKQKLLSSETRLRDTLKQNIQSMISLHVQFEPEHIMQTSVYLVLFLTKYINNLFETAFKMITSNTNKTNEKQIYSHLACQLDNYSILQMKYLAYNLTTFVSDLIVSEELLIKLADLYDDSMSTNMTNMFQDLLEKILLLILKLTNITNQFNKHENNTTKEEHQTIVNDLKKFHKAILNKAYDMMERSISLLDSKQFIDAIQRLIKHDSLQIRRRMLNLLNNKLRKYEPTELETSLLIGLIDDLISLINLKHFDKDSMETDENLLDVEINNQTILFSIKLLCKRIGEQNPLAFVKVLKYLSSNLIKIGLYRIDGNNFNNINLLSSVLLCSGELCLKLKSNALVHLNQIMLFTLDIIDTIRDKYGKEIDLIDDLTSAKSQITLMVNKNLELLILSSVSCLVKIVQNMGNFLSPFLPRLLYLSCSLSSLTTNYQNEINKLNSTFSQIDLKLRNLRSSLASLIPLRLLVPVLTQQSQIKNVSESNTTTYYMSVKTLEFYMDIVKLAVKNSSQEELIINIRNLRSMYMNLFDLRSIYCMKCATHQDLITSQIGRYENYTIDAFCEMIFKLSEDLFRPIFFNFYEWATVNQPPKDRLVTFYSTTLKLAEKLKNLFVLFSAQFIPNASQMIDNLNIAKTSEKFFSSKSFEKERLLLLNIINTLSNVFLNDTQKTLITKDCFKILIQPLVDQIENEIDYMDYNEYINAHLAPCIANLASICVQDDSLCRKFNYQILLKTKHNSVRVRLAALDVLSLFSKRIGDMYNSYLSETVPFLAELMEDTNEKVEERTQEYIRELEDMLGESLQSHFV